MVVCAIDLHCRIDEYQLRLRCLNFDTPTDTISDLLKVERVQTIILGIFGRGYCEYFLVRKPHKVYITVPSIFSAVSLNWRVMLHNLLHSVPMHGAS